MTIILVRHGETAFNRDGQGLGRADVPLTETGLGQARAVARRLSNFPIERVVTSPLTRARTVAEYVSGEHGIEPQALEELRELDVGETEGLEFSEMRRRFPEFMTAWAGPDGWRSRMPGGESIEDLSLRLRGLADELAADREGAVVVVSHNFVLRTLLCLLLRLDLERFRAFQLDLASATFLTVRGGRVSVTSVNDTCHLSNLNLA